MQAFAVNDVTANTDALNNLLVDDVANKCIKRLMKTTPEAAASDCQRLVTTRFNPLVATIDMAFREHRPLVLRPDDIWLCVAQGLSQHINLHAEALRKRLVTWDGKQRIQISRDNFRRGSPDNDWLGVFEEFRQRIAEKVPVVYNRLNMHFSTTSLFDDAAMDLTLMEAMSPYFEYGMSTACGIPFVKLEGHAADWEELYYKISTTMVWWRDEVAKENEELSLEWWFQPLFRVARQLSNTAEYVENHMLDLHADLQNFWEGIYKLNGMSGGPYITGWVNNLFPYLCGNDDKPTRKNFAIGSTMAYGGPKLDMYPVGISSAPLIWNYMGTELDMLLVAGFGGIAQDENGSVRASRVWGVCEAKK